MRALNLPFGLLPLKCHSNSVRITHYQLSFLLRNDITQISIKIETLEEAHKRTTNREFWENLHFHPEKPFFPQHSFLFLLLVSSSRFPLSCLGFSLTVQGERRGQTVAKNVESWHQFLEDWLQQDRGRKLRAIILPSPLKTCSNSNWLGERVEAKGFHYYGLNERVLFLRGVGRQPLLNTKT